MLFPLLVQVFRCWIVQGLPKGDLVLKDKAVLLTTRFAKN